MADITKDSFIESNRHTKIIFQRARDVVDFELNEMQDISRTLVYRALEAQSQGLNPGSNDEGYKIVGTGANNQVTVKAGTLFVDGVPVLLTADQTLAGIATNVGGDPIVLSVYLAVSEIEIVDPAMIPELGETTRRNKLVVTVSTIEGEDLPADSINEIWRGGTRNYKIAEITRPVGQDEIEPGEVQDFRFVMPAFYVGLLVNQAAIFPPPITSTQTFYEPTGWSDAAVVQVTSDAPYQIIGLSPNVRLKRKTFVNAGDYPIELFNDVVGTGEEKILNTVTVYPKGAVDLTFNDAADGWHVVYPGDPPVVPDEVQINPTILGAAASINNYNPTGWGGATIVVLSATDAAAVIRGLESVGSGVRKTLVNGGSYRIRFTHNDGAATWDNALFLADSGGLYLYPGEAVEIVRQAGGSPGGWRFVTTPYRLKDATFTQPLVLQGNNTHSGANTHSGVNSFTNDNTFGGLTTLGTVAAGGEIRLGGGASLPYKNAAGAQEYRDRTVVLGLMKYGETYNAGQPQVAGDSWRSGAHFGLRTMQTGDNVWLDLNEVLPQGCKLLTVIVLYQLANVSGVRDFEFGYQPHDLNVLGPAPGATVDGGAFSWTVVNLQTAGISDYDPAFFGRIFRLIDGSAHVVDKTFHEYKLRIRAGDVETGGLTEYINFIVLLIRDYDALAK